MKLDRISSIVIRCKNNLACLNRNVFIISGVKANTSNCRFDVNCAGPLGAISRSSIINNLDCLRRTCIGMKFNSLTGVVVGCKDNLAGFDRDILVVSSMEANTSNCRFDVNCTRTFGTISCAFVIDNLDRLRLTSIGMKLDSFGSIMTSGDNSLPTIDRTIFSVRELKTDATSGRIQHDCSILAGAPIAGA